MRIRVYSDLHLYISNDDIDRYDSTELLDLKTNLYTDPVDVLIFAGDLTHKVYSTDDRRFVHAMKFVADIRKACKETNTIFRIIKGTATHEGKIIEVLQQQYENDDILKCYTQVAYENIRGLIFRFLPEPYFDNYTNFYQYAFSHPADITAFHGTINGVIPYLKKTDNPTNLPKSVIIETEDLLNNTRLFSVGGHIHKFININNRIFYTNSLTTHNFSDIDNIKGYMEFDIKEDYTWKWKYIENHKAPTFHRIVIENLHTKRKEDLRTLIGNNMLRMKNIDRIEFVVTGLRSIEGLSNLEFIKSLTRKYRVKITQKLEDDFDETEKNQNSDFYSDPSVSIVDKIQKLAEEQGLILQKEEIENYIKG